MDELTRMSFGGAVDRKKKKTGREDVAGRCRDKEKTCFL
jgi:hypothetical protein